MSTLLMVSHGIWAEQLSVKEAVSELLKQKPAVVWCEPVPTRNRLSNAPGLWFAHQALPDDPRLETEEARLFWADGWVHLLHGKPGVRWAAFREQKAVATWLAALPVAAGTLERPVLVRPKHRILLLTDLRRYGLTEFKDQFKRPLNVVEYYSGTTLVGWNLLVEAQL